MGKKTQKIKSTKIDDSLDQKHFKEEEKEEEETTKNRQQFQRIIQLQSLGYHTLQCWQQQKKLNFSADVIQIEDRKKKKEIRILLPLLPQNCRRLEKDRVSEISNHKKEGVKLITK